MVRNHGIAQRTQIPESPLCKGFIPESSFIKLGGRHLFRLYLLGGRPIFRLYLLGGRQLLDCICWVIGNLFTSGIGLPIPKQQQKMTAAPKAPPGK